MKNLLQDIRYGLRKMWKSPGLVIVVGLSIGLGSGLNITIFSLIDAILLQPLPVITQQDQLVELYTSSPGLRFGAVSYPDYADYRNTNQVFSDLIAQRVTPVSMSNGGNNQIVAGIIVSGNYFSALGVTPLLGRAFSPEEDRTANSYPVAVISHAMWQRAFGGDTQIVGKSVVINSQAFNIVGVAPEGFIGTSVGLAPDIWFPLMMQARVLPGSDRLTDRGARWLNVIGRLKSGVSREQAEAGMQPIVNRLAQDYANTNKGTSPTVVPLGEGSVGIRKNLSSVLLLLMAVVFLVLLIACFNVANLMLARALARQKEIGLRQAIGATRSRLVQQLLTESVLFSLLGGIVGLVVAFVATRLLVNLVPPTPIPVTFDISLNNGVFVFALVVSVLTGIIFGLAPAIQTTKVNLLPALKDDGAGQQGYKKSRLRNLLVMGQVAISLILLICAGLFLRSLQNAQNSNPGFEPEKLLAISTDVGLQGYDQETGQRYYQQLAERLGKLPGVESGSVGYIVPLSGGGQQQIAVQIPGYEPPPDTILAIDYNTVGPNFFQVMSIPLLQGRDFSDFDTKDAAGVCIINEAMAKRFWPEGNPIDQHLSITRNKTPLKVIAVVKNSKYYSLKEEPRPYLYLPFLQNYQARMTVFAKTSTDAASLLPVVRREVESLDKNMPARILTMRDALSFILIPQKLAAILLTIFSLLALALATVGLYAVMAYSVSKRTREIGIRMALGAQRGDVLKLILRQGMFLTVIGLGIGLAASIALTRFFAGLLYGISPTDFATFAAITVFQVAIALVASYIPARRATKVNPLIALKYE
ncbi:MAG TPA: ABC transporter permease [Pyrinomonadaceae bacterium]|nr:ABC transporter permease [Pyrinomonadaceae bacterium]